MEKSGPSHVARALGDAGTPAARRLAQGFRLGAWLVQPGLCTLTGKSGQRQLEPKVMGVLLCLAQHAPQVVTREQFIRDVWDGRTVTDEVLSRSISLLRTQLGDDAHEPRFIRTIPRIGYALIIPVESRHESATGAPIRVAVLPFTNLGGDADKEYFVEGLADELMANLSRVDGIHVVARTSVQRFRNQDGDVRKVGQSLGATHLVKGSVNSDGQRLRVSVHLIDAVRDHEVWAEAYDRAVADLFAVQTDISSAIMQSLAREPPQTFSGGLRPPTWSLEAYQSYLRGQQLLKRRGAAAIRSSIELFSEAASLDPNFARAQVALAYAYTLLPSYTSVDAAAMYAHADQALAAAGGTDEASIGAAGVRAVLEVRRNRWIAAEEAFRAELSANPGNSEVRQWYSQLQGGVGKLRAAHHEAQQALADDPLSPILNFRVAVTCLWNDQDAEAERQFGVARELGLEPSVTPEAFAMLLVRQRRFGDLKRAFVWIQHARQQSDEWVATIVAAMRDRGSNPKVESLIERTFAAGQMSWGMYVGTLVLTGHHGRALESLLARPEVNPTELEPLYIRESAAVRQHPSFGRLIAKLRLDEYWDRYGWPPGCVRTEASIQFQ